MRWLIDTRRFTTLMLTLLMVGGGWIVASRDFISRSAFTLSAAPQIGFAAPDFDLEALDGGRIKLADLRGKVVMVNLWASWCPPCRAEMPDLIKYYNEHQAEGLVLLAIDSEDDKDAAQQFIREKQMPFPVLFDPNALAARTFGSKGLPSTFLIDRTGAVRFSWTGQISPATLDQRVTPLLTQ